MAGYSLLALLLFASLGSAQYCTVITREDLDALLPLYLNDHSVELVNYKTTCLALSETEGRYRYVTVLVKIQSTTGDISLDTWHAMIDIGCSEDHWNTTVLGVFNAYTMLDNAVTSVETRLDCSMCAGEQLLSGLNTTTQTSDSNTHCVACSTSCSGGGGCTGPNDDHCCSVYEGGLCAHSCSSGYEAAINHTCIPTTGGNDDDPDLTDGDDASALVLSHTTDLSPAPTSSSTPLPPPVVIPAVEFTVMVILISSVTNCVVTVLLSVCITLVIVFTCCGGKKMIKRGTVLSSTNADHIKPTSRATPRSQSFIYLERNPSYCMIQTPPRAAHEEEGVIYDVPETFKSKAHTYMTVIG